MGKRKWWFLVGSIIIIVLLVLFLIWASYNQLKFDVYDPTSFSPNGLKAINLLLDQAGYQIRKIKSIPHAGIQLIIIPTYNGLTSREQKKIFSWVNSGGTIIELAPSKPVLHRKSFEVPIKKLNKKSADKNQVVPANQAWLKNLKYHYINSNPATVVEPNEGLFGIKKRFFIYMQKFGSGRIVYWNDLNGLLNINVKKYPDNAVIFALLIKEYSLSQQIGFLEIDSTIGHQNPSFYWKTDLNRYWFAGLIFLFGIMILLWKIAARFGRPRPLVLAKGRSADEFVDAMASLFLQANARTIVLDNLYEDLVHTIEKMTGLPFGEDFETPAECIQTNFGVSYHQQLAEITAIGRRIKTETISRPAFLGLVIKLDNYRKEFRKWRSFKNS